MAYIKLAHLIKRLRCLDLHLKEDPPKPVGSTEEEGADVRADRWEDINEMLPLRHVVASVHVTSLKLWLLAQNQAS